MGTSTEGFTVRIKEFLGRHRFLIPALLIFLVIAFFLYSTMNGLYSRGIEQEQRLNAQYLDNQNYLSSYVLGFHEQVSVAQATTASLDKVLLDAVKGRYESTSAGGGGYTVNSPFFNALREAYPEASTQQLVTNWGKIQDFVVAGREGYRNTQSKLLDILRSYDTWRNSGLIQSSLIRILGYPSTHLIARIGNAQLTSQSALDKMYEIVLTPEALQSYESGTQNPLTVPSP